MRFAIIGAGAVGSLYGASLALAGFDVILVHRDVSTVRTIQKNGITLTGINGKTNRVRVPIRKGPVNLPGIEVVIVAVKAYDTLNVARSYRKMIPQDATVLSLQNGLGNVETLHSILKNHTLAGSTTEGALLSAPGRVAHTGKGLTVIGDVEGTISKPTAAIQVAFDTAGFRTKTSLNIRGMLWTKAIVNAAINPLSSLTRLPNGELVKNTLIRDVGNRAIEEGISVALAMRVRLTDNPKRLWTRILSATRANKSSMLQDIEKGKRTEIRQLNGAIVRSGKRVRVATPVNDVLMRLVLGLEKSQGL